MRHTVIKETRIKNGLRVAIHEPVKGLTQTNEIASGSGVDANPYPGIKGIFAKATSAGRGVVLAFINRFLAAQPGEIRIYSTDAQGDDIVAFLHFLNDGSYIISGDGSAIGDLLIDGKLTVDGDFDVNGDLNVNNGDITVTGGDVVVDGVSSKFHRHDYVSPSGPAQTGPPN